MADRLHLWQETHKRNEGQVTVGVILEQDGQNRSRLWYRLPEAYAFAVTPSADPFVLGTLFKAMRERTDLVVHGEVSPVLLRNLQEFQGVWGCWLPEFYQPIEITADIEREQTRVESGATICAFSGGVDAAFTAWRHRNAQCGRLQRDLRAGVFVHGMDIPLQEPEVYEHVLAHSRAMLSSIGMDVIPIATNLRQFKGNWLYALGAGVASCLALLQAGWNTGLIASGWSYDRLELPLGTTPLTDPLLSTGSFEIVHDGATVHRIDKIRALANWSEASKNLRVCWQGNQRDNCCRCRKCIRTILAFRAIGAALPECFSQDINNRQILTTGSAAFELEFLAETVAAINAGGSTGSWVWATRLALAISHAREAGKRILRANHAV